VTADCRVIVVSVNTVLSSVGVRGDIHFLVLYFLSWNHHIFISTSEWLVREFFSVLIHITDCGMKTLQIVQLLSLVC